MDKENDEERGVRLAKQAVAAIGDGQIEVHPSLMESSSQSLISMLAWLKSSKRSYLIGTGQQIRQGCFRQDPG